MRRFTLIAVVIGLNLASFTIAAGQSGLPILSSNTLTIRGDGTAFWNGTKVDADTFHGVCREVAQRKPLPEIHVKPDRLAKYDAVAKILTEIQKTGCTNIGFTGVDNGH